ncbi:MAG: hypothetical protein K1X92_04215 [Bacteroidia bacterium]|nr:hypothetical protein [Bacteroidia bacterium]
MKIQIAVNTFSIECGEDINYSKNMPFHSKLYFNAESLRKTEGTGQSPGVEPLPDCTYRISGKVIFKGEYLLIIEHEIRIGLVLNQEFIFGNHLLLGNKEIDHTEIQVGEYVEATGYFKFANIYLSIFTFLPDEIGIPDTDYLWAIRRIFHIGYQWEDIDFRDISSLKEVNVIDTNTQTIEDFYVLEIELVSNIPEPLGNYSGFSGWVQSSCWITENEWIINCEGRIIDGVKQGEWVYFDKSGSEKKVIIYP